MGYQKDTIAGMSRSEKKQAKRDYKSQTKEERRANLVKYDSKLLTDYNRLTGKSTKGLDKLDAPLEKGERNSLQLKTDRLNKLKSMSNLDRTLLDANKVGYGKTRANRILDRMGKDNISLKDAKRRINNEYTAQQLAIMFM